MMASPVKNTTVTNEDLLDFLKNLDTKVTSNGKDLVQIRDNVAELSGKIFELQVENDKLKKEISKAREREARLEESLNEVRERAEHADKRVEELSQYSRLENLRFYGIPEASGREEKVEECEEKIVKVCVEKLKVPIKKEDIAAVHRLGKRDKDREGSRAVIVRFVSRRVRDSVIRERRRLSKTGIVIVEDLTPHRHALLQAVKNDDQVCSQAWSSGGRVFMKPHVGKIVTISSQADLKADIEQRKVWAGLMRANKRIRSPGQLEMELEEAAEDAEAAEGGSGMEQQETFGGSVAGSPKRPARARRGGGGARGGRGRGGMLTPRSGIDNYFSPLASNVKESDQKID